MGGAIPSFSHVLSWRAQGLIGLYMLSMLEMKIKANFVLLLLGKYCKKFARDLKYILNEDLSLVYETLYTVNLYVVHLRCVRNHTYNK
jgi:hypothetical protein